MKIRIYILTVLLSVSAIADAQLMIDPVRMAAYANWNAQNRKTMEAQSLVIASLTYHHEWIKGKEEDIADLQREFNNYLQQVQGTIAVAAQLYGQYYEMSELYKNIKNIREVCEESPTNVVANAFKEEKRQIVTNIVNTTSELLMDIKKTIIDKTRMTEQERLSLMDGIRRKMKDINKRLKRVERNIRYYNLCNLWNDIRNSTYVFRHKTNREIAIEARDKWMEHYRPVFSDVQFSKGYARHRVNVNQ